MQQDINWFHDMKDEMWEVEVGVRVVNYYLESILGFWDALTALSYDEYINSNKPTEDYPTIGNTHCPHCHAEVQPGRGFCQECINLDHCDYCGGNPDDVPHMQSKSCPIYEQDMYEDYLASREGEIRAEQDEIRFYEEGSYSTNEPF